MDSEMYPRYQSAMLSAYYPHTTTSFLDFRVEEPEQIYGSDMLSQISSGKVFMVNSRKRNGLILFKRYHAEFAGPGAAVGGDYDRDCIRILPIGKRQDLLLPDDTFEERQKGYLIRRQWVRLIKQITENPDPQQRVQKILDQFEQYFPTGMVQQLPDDAFAMLVGVLPQTVAIVRRFGGDGDS
jgi:hypothetical protein